MKILTDTQLQNPSVETLKTVLYNTNYISSIFNDLLFEYFERGLPVDKLEFKKDNISSSFLYYAVLKGNFVAVKYMLDHGANPNYHAGLNRSTALHRACLHHNLELVSILLKHGANPNLRDGGKSTPMLMLIMGVIAENGNAYRLTIKHDIIKELIKYGANPYASSFGNRNSLDVALIYYGKEMYDFILDEYNWHRRRKLVMCRSLIRNKNPVIRDIKSASDNAEIPNWAKDVGITLENKKTV